MTRQLLRRLRGDERGSAMTEFVLTLPIFLMIFGGMGMLYRYNEEALVARMQTVRLLSKDTMAPNIVPGFIPGAGGIVSINTFGDLILNGSGALGMYADSKFKAGLAETLIPGQAIPNPASPPKGTIDQITLMSGLNANQSFTNSLLNDRANPAWDGSSWAGIVMSIVGTLGVGPSLAAGIRYQPIQKTHTHNFYHPWTGNTSYNPGQLSLASPTAAHWRVATVALARVATNTIEPYKECTLKFDKHLCSGGNPGGNTGQMNNINQAATACQAASDDWQACLDACALNPPAPPFDCQDVCDSRRPSDDCADIGKGLAGQINNGSIPGCPGPGCGQPRP